MKIHLLFCGVILISFIPVGGYHQEAKIDSVTPEEYAVYSAGYITFSRVGFNSDGTKAVIYRETVCGSLCGYGGYVLLSKDDGAWKEIDGYGCWMS